jgi:tRNA-dihydrouridine synthase B
MEIGSYKLENNLILAPMAGITDRPFRQLCRNLGAGLAVSEMISADASLWGSKKTLRRLDHRGEPGPIAVQILGADPGEMAAAARANQAHGAQIIDINMGCPAKKVCRKAAGSALLQHESLVAEILQRVVAAVTVPVTLKIRTGQNPRQRNAVRIAAIAEAAGISALTVHGRTRACKFNGEAEYETIREIKRAVSIPVVANGDIDSPHKAHQILQLTAADGLMIGRAALGRPWIFRQVAHYLRTGNTLPAPDPQWIAELVLTHLRQLYEFYGEYMGTRIARKHIAWYTKSLPGGAGFRDRINRTESARQQLEYTKDFFTCLQDKGELAA